MALRAALKNALASAYLFGSVANALHLIASDDERTHPKMLRPRATTIASPPGASSGFLSLNTDPPISVPGSSIQCWPPGLPWKPYPLVTFDNCKFPLQELRAYPNFRTQQKFQEGVSPTKPSTAPYAINAYSACFIFIQEAIHRKNVSDYFSFEQAYKLAHGIVEMCQNRGRGGSAHIGIEENRWSVTVSEYQPFSGDGIADISASVDAAVPQSQRRSLRSIPSIGIHSVNSSIGQLRVYDIRCFDPAPHRSKTNVDGCRPSLNELKQIYKWKVRQVFLEGQKPKIKIPSDPVVRAPPFYIHHAESDCMLAIAGEEGIKDEFSFEDVRSAATEILEECSSDGPGLGGASQLGSQNGWIISVSGFSKGSGESGTETFRQFE